MNSRMERHYELNKTSSNRRTFRNQDLYKSIYEDMEYTNVEGITSIGRTNDIDIAKIKELLKDREEYKKERESIVKTSSEVIEKVEDNIEKNYDIRDILVKAKSERHVDDDKKRSLDDEKYNILRRIDQTKENTKTSLKEIEQEENELKELLHTLTNTAMLRKMDDKDLSIDIFDELKSTGHTEIVGTSTSIKAVMDEKIKKDDEDEEEQLDNSFYTGTIELDEEDFEDLKEVGKTMKKNNILITIVLILLFVIILCFGMYFIQPL